jgi:hypothetical protein
MRYLDDHTISKIALICLMLGSPTSTSAQANKKCYGAGEASRPSPTIGDLMQDLTSDNWPEVATAKLRLESRQDEAIPALIELTKSDQRMRLEDTWDLIYPGAETYYGHGFIVDYDLDWLSVRAGWVLEEMTFENFGFSAGDISKAELMQATLAGKADQPLEDVVKLNQDLEAKREKWNAAAKRAQDWWSGRNGKWNRADAIIEAIQSGDGRRLGRAFEWIRNGDTRCAGFNRDYVKARLVPAVKKLPNSEKKDRQDILGYLKPGRNDAAYYKAKNEGACY